MIGCMSYTLANALLVSRNTPQVAAKPLCTPPLSRTPCCAICRTIGQSVSRLSETLREAHPEIDWRSIIGLRNVLVHDYLGINLERIWDIIERDVPALQRTVDAILRVPGGV